MEAEAGQRFPKLVTARKSDLCYATTNRQDAVRAMTGECDLILVVGSVNSSNTQALVRTANVMGTPAYRVDNVDGISEDWLEGADVVGVTAGASAPDYLVREVLERLDPVEGWHLFSVADEQEYFPLPPGLRKFVGALTQGMELGFTSRPGGRGPIEQDRHLGPMSALDSLR